MQSLSERLMNQAFSIEPDVAAWAIRKAHFVDGFTCDQSFVDHPPELITFKTLECYRLYKELHPEWYPTASHVRNSGEYSPNWLKMLTLLDPSAYAIIKGLSSDDYGGEEVVRVFKKNDWEPTVEDAINAAKCNNI